MRLMERNKRTIHVAAREEMNGVEFYAEPVEKKVNFRTARPFASMEVPGESVSSELVCMVSHTDGADFAEFDKVYVFTTPPTTYDAAAATADFIVSSSTSGLNHTEVRMKRVQT